MNYYKELLKERGLKIGDTANIINNIDGNMIEVVVMDSFFYDMSSGEDVMLNVVITYGVLVGDFDVEKVEGVKGTH